MRRQVADFFVESPNTVFLVANSSGNQDILFR